MYDPLSSQRGDGFDAEADQYQTPTSYAISRKPVAQEHASQLLTDESPPTGKTTPQYFPLRTSVHDQDGKSHGKLPQAQGLLRRWAWEIFSTCVACAALIAIVITLNVFDDKSLSSWRAPISINAVVAILSALFRGALVLPISSGIAQLKWLSFLRRGQALANMDTYDQASRGAWGAVRLLKRQFGGARISPIATVGAVIILLALIAEPFSQATVSVGICDRVRSEMASIPRWSNYEGATHTGAGFASFGPSMGLAVYQGLYDTYKNSSQLMEKAVSCPSGNCTWSSPVTLQTITMCHSCRDVSDRIGRIGTGPYALAGFGSATFDDLAEMVTNTSTLFPERGLDPAISWPDGPWPQTSLVDFQGIANLIDREQCPKDYPYLVCNSTGLLAFDCSLRPCVKTFRASMTNNKYTEEEVSRSYMHVVNHLIPDNGKFQLGLNETFLNGTWRTCHGEPNLTESNTVAVATYPTTQQAVENGTAPPLLYYPNECVYDFGLQDHAAMYQLLTKTFTHARVDRETPYQTSGDPWLAQLWAEGNITMDSVDLFAENLANTIGQEMRSNGGVTNYWVGPEGNQTSVPIPPEYLKATGDVHQSEPCIQVHWKYSAFLGILLALELVFFAAILVVDWRDGQTWRADWKTTILPILFQAVGRDERLLQRGATGGADDLYRGKFYERAKTVDVQLVESRRGWEFDVQEEK